MLVAPSKLELEAELCRRSLRRFAVGAWPLVEPGVPFVSNWHIDAICEHLEAVSRREIRRLIINIPPRCMKSLTVAVFWPCWEWLARPETKWLYLSYAEKLSHRDSLKCRRLIKSEGLRDGQGRGILEQAGYQGLLRALYGDEAWQLAADQDAKGKFENTRRGYRLATSTRGGPTGEGGDVVCLPGGVPLITDHGEIPIGRIVDERLDVRVLGSSGRWQAIEAWERNPPRPLVEITLETGAQVRCTEDHPIWLEGRGFRPAREVMWSRDLCMRQLRPGVRQAASARGAQHAGSVLFPPVLRAVGAWASESRLGRRAHDLGVPAVWLPSQEPPQERAERGLDAPVRIVGVRRRPAPAAVYNVSVEPDHNYYAAGVLVHNCIDDPHKIDEAESDQVRQGVIESHDATIPTRFNQPKTGAEVVVMQRLHEEDLAGHLLEQGGWTQLCLPMEFEPKHPFVWPGDPRRAEGELLWPERIGPAELEAMKIGMGAYRAAGQLQQRPAPAEGLLFKRKHFRRWRLAESQMGAMTVATYLLDTGEEILHVDAGLCRRFQTVDVAASDKTTADFTVVATWALTPSRKLLAIEVDRQRFDTLDVAGFLKRKSDEHGRPPMWIEIFGAGKGPYGTLQRAGYPVMPLRPEQGTQLDKVARAWPSVAAYEAHDVFHPVEAPWLGEFEHELLSFPKGRNDDQVDAASYACRLLPVIGVGEFQPQEDPGPPPATAGIREQQF